MTDYTLSDDLLSVTLGDGGAAIQNCTLQVHTRPTPPTAPTILVSAIQSDVSGNFVGAVWPDYSGEVVAKYFYDDGTKHPPRAIIAQAVLTPYQVPAFETDTPADVQITGTRIDIIGSNVQRANTVDLVIDATPGNIYVYQFDTNMQWPSETPLVRYQSTSDLSLTPNASEYLELATGRSRFGSNLIDGGSNFGTVLAGSAGGTAILDTTTKELTLYSTAGALIATFAYNQQGELAATGLYLGLFCSIFADIGDYFEFFLDKNLMPNSLVAGDLGVYLAANPNWLQIGE